MADSDYADSVASDSRSNSPAARSIVLGGATDSSFIQDVPDNEADLDYTGVQQPAEPVTSSALPRLPLLCGIGQQIGLRQKLSSSLTIMTSVSKTHTVLLSYASHVS